MSAKTPKGKKSKAGVKSSLPVERMLLADVRDLILSARNQIAQTANATLTLLHWQIGNRIRREILKEKRAEYGAEIVSSLATQLESEFGRGFGRRNLFHMIRFAEVFPDLEIVQSLISQLGCTHFFPSPSTAPMKCSM
jgi:hypothetical protein